MDELSVEQLGRVVRVTIDRAERKNALSVPMWLELARLLTAFDADPTQRLMILTGAGGVFCAGGDLSSSGRDETDDDDNNQAKQDERTFESMRSTVTAVCLGIHRARKPVIAAVDGLAAGAGANLAFGCDLVLASESARFSEIFIRRGLPMDSGGSWLLPRLVGLQKAKQLAFFGDWIPAEEALALGLVSAIVPPERLADEALAWAERLADQSQAAIALNKRALNRAFDRSFEEALDDEAQGLAEAMRSPEAQAAIRAFFAKRSS